jgi:hypothetical protein
MSENNQADVGADEIIAELQQQFQKYAEDRAAEKQALLEKIATMEKEGRTCAHKQASDSSLNFPEDAFQDTLTNLVRAGVCDAHEKEAVAERLRVDPVFVLACLNKTAEAVERAEQRNKRVVEPTGYAVQVGTLDKAAAGDARKDFEEQQRAALDALRAAVSNRF